MQNNWINTGVAVRMTGAAKTFQKLDVGVYELDKDDDGFFLSIVASEFIFSHKVYGIETPFIERAIKTYENTTQNLGILLNGVKGTGKSVTAKQLCNKLNLPVILISKKIPDAESFIKTISQDIVVFIDEYEKIYQEVRINSYESKTDTSILALMDGALSGPNRRVFLLTTNQLKIDDNLKSRPGRIRYHRNYTDLSAEAVDEILTDLLEDQSVKAKLIKQISNLELITVDIVKSIAEEVNIHGDLLEDFSDIFNVSIINETYNIYSDEKVPQLIKSGMQASEFEKLGSGKDLTGTNDEYYRIQEPIDFDSGLIRVKLYDNDEDGFIKPVTLKFEKVRLVHMSYKHII